LTEDALVFRASVRGDAETVNAWLRYDSEHGVDFLDNQDWAAYFDAVTRSPHYFLRTVTLAAEIIGVIALEVEDKTGYISLQIAPDRRNQGLGKRALNAFLNSIETIIPTSVERVQAEIAPRNAASVRCFEACGFRRAGTAGDGMARYSIARQAFTEGKNE
jgi:RimJ/RimL family protein N-acetyltransferase